MTNLGEKYLPDAQFITENTEFIKSSPAAIYPYLEYLDFSEATLTHLLFQLRGINVPKGTNVSTPNQSNFILLEKVPDKGIVLGLVGQFWKLSGKLQHFDASEFASLPDKGYAKAVWYFYLTPAASGTILTAETRIFCPDEHTLSKFKKYWKVVKPFSGIIRHNILKAIRNNAGN